MENIILKKNKIVINKKIIKINDIIEIYLNDKKFQLDNKFLEKLINLYYENNIKNIKYYKRINCKEIKNCKQIAQGKNGKIFKYSNNYIIKEINNINTNIESDIMYYLINNIYFKKLSPNILLLYDSFQWNNKKYLILEKVNFNLCEYIVKYSTNNYKNIKNIILQTILSIIIIQNNIKNYTHNDLKIDNILLSKNRQKDITIKFKSLYWYIPKNIPLVKISDYDFSNIPHIYENNKLKTNYCKDFGCKQIQCNFYDIHLFLNSLYCYKKYLNNNIIVWIEKYIPPYLRGIDNKYLKYGRLKNPNKWDNILKNPEYLIKDKFFDEFKINNKYINNELIWG